MKVVLKTFFLLCALICLLCFPWAFLPWKITEEVVNMQNEIPIGSGDLAVFLYRFQCLFFIFFAIYFLILCFKTRKYKPIIAIGSFLIMGMGVYMYWLKGVSGLNNLSSALEPVIWITGGTGIWLLNRFGIRSSEKPVRSVPGDFEVVLLRVIAVMMAGALLFIPFLSEVADRLSKDLVLAPVAIYALGLILSFLGFSSVIVGYLSDKTTTYKELYLLVIGVLLFFPATLFIWNLYYRFYSVVLGIITLLLFFCGLLLLYKYRQKSITI